MAYAIIADWDDQMRVSRYNYVETEAEAKRLVDRLLGADPLTPRKVEMQALLDDPVTSQGKRAWAAKEILPLSPAKRAPNAYYVLMPTAPAGTALFTHRARFWIADPVNKTVSFDTAACHAWQSKVTSQAIDTEADKRIDKVFSPDAPGRAERIKLELFARGHELQDKGRAAWTADEKAEWNAGIALNNRAKALRAAAQVLKDLLATKTPKGILDIDSADDIHWPE